MRFICASCLPLVVVCTVVAIAASRPDPSHQLQSVSPRFRFGGTAMTSDDVTSALRRPAPDIFFGCASTCVRLALPPRRLCRSRAASAPVAAGPHRIQLGHHWDRAACPSYRTRSMSRCWSCSYARRGGTASAVVISHEPNEDVALRVAAPAISTPVASDGCPSRRLGPESHEFTEGRMRVSREVDCKPSSRTDSSRK